VNDGSHKVSLIPSKQFNKHCSELNFVIFIYDLNHIILWAFCQLDLPHRLIFIKTDFSFVYKHHIKKSCTFLIVIPDPNFQS